MSSKLTIEAIEILDTISRKGSFAAAANALYKVPSALTYQMGKLEKDLDIALFNRDGYRTTLTPAGEALLNQGRQLLEVAESVESHVKRVATGIETNLVIAITDLIRVEALYPILNAFYEQGFGTRVKLIREVFGGTWDAIATERADIALGAPGDPPIGGGYHTKTLGNIEFVFAVSPQHPLAALPEPLSSQAIVQYRAVVAADSSRNLPPRTAGILTGQDVLTVPDMQTKISAQIAGLGVGYLPSTIVDRYAKTGQLVPKRVTEPKTSISIHTAWSSSSQKEMGQAQRWLIKQFTQMSLDELLLQCQNDVN